MPPGVECRGPECYPPLSLNQGSEMDIPPRFVIHETRHWLINHRVDSALPGYLMLGAKSMSPSLAALPSEALAELGGLQAMLQTTLDEHLQPRHLYIGRFGHQAGHSIHFHFIPVYPWLEALFWSDDSAMIAPAVEPPQSRITRKPMLSSLIVNGQLLPAPTNEPLTPWWSFTKTVLATTALSLVRDDLIGLDDPVDAQPFTLRQLLRHEAGLADYGELADYHAAVARAEPAWSPDEMMRRLDGDRLRYPPGTGWGYSNVGYMLISRLIERVTDRPLEEAVTQRALFPLGLANVHFAKTPADLHMTHLGNALNYDPAWVYHGLLIGPLSQAALVIAVYRICEGDASACCAAFDAGDSQGAVESEREADHHPHHYRRCKRRGSARNVRHGARPTRFLPRSDPQRNDPAVQAQQHVPGRAVIFDRGVRVHNGQSERTMGEVFYLDRPALSRIAGRHVIRARLARDQSLLQAHRSLVRQADISAAQ
nr:hypothetical protein [Tanacetum cinerariifolium]